MENVAPSQDVRAKQSPDQHEAPPTDQISLSEPGKTEGDNSSEPLDNVHKKRHKAATKSLCIHLSLFTVFKNPKALFKEPELRQLFMRFLAHREGEVQKLAVKCLMTYKFNFLEPYKENIERLLDDENFRDELAHFSVDEESGIVNASHREGLMPILIRLVVSRDRTGHVTRINGNITLCTFKRHRGICLLQRLQLQNEININSTGCTIRYGTFFFLSKLSGPVV